RVTARRAVHNGPVADWCAGLDRYRQRTIFRAGLPCVPTCRRQKLDRRGHGRGLHTLLRNRVGKLAAAAAAGALLMAATACGGNDDTAATATSETSAAPAASALKVGLAYDIGGRGDGSFNDAAARGLDQAVSEL